MTSRNTVFTLDLAGRDIDEVIAVLREAYRGQAPERGSELFLAIAEAIEAQCPPPERGLGWYEVVYTDDEQPVAMLARYWTGSGWSYYQPPSPSSTVPADRYRVVRPLVPSEEGPGALLAARDRDGARGPGPATTGTPPRPRTTSTSPTPTKEIQ